MISALLILEAVTLALVIFLLLRKSNAAVGGTALPDPRLETLLAADLPAALARAEVRADAQLGALDQHMRAELTQLRGDARADAQSSREAAATAAAGLRTEVLGNMSTLGGTLRTGLDGLRGDNKTDSEKLRATVEARLDKLNELNAAKLEEMRQTVDEKLHATLQTRLTESFGQVTDQLTKVHSGLGEMTKLSAGVDDLSRIFTNVKSRGGFAEVQLGMLLAQMLAPSQFQQNVRVKPNTQEVVEYAVKFPTPQGETLLPIDAKFPREAWERLETAYAGGTPADIASAGKAFETAIRTEGKRICEKYIAPPNTTSFAIMFLPTEGLYAEVMRRDGLQADIQQNCRVTIAGPTTLSAILNSFQMGFHMLQMQEKGDEVWKVLAKARQEFGTFENLMEKMTSDIGRVQGTIDKLSVRTRVINRTLRDVNVEDSPALGTGTDGIFGNVVPMLAAEDDD